MYTLLSCYTNVLLFIYYDPKFHMFVGSIYIDLLRFRPWDPAQTLDLSKKTPHFFTMRSEDSETAHLLGSGPVLRHNNACVRDVLTAPSNVYLNLGLNLFHSYF